MIYFQRCQQCGAGRHETGRVGLQPRGECQREADQDQPGEGRPRPEEVHQGDAARHGGEEQPRTAGQRGDCFEEHPGQRGQRLVEPGEAGDSETEGEG